MFRQKESGEIVAFQREKAMPFFLRNALFRQRPTIGSSDATEGLRTASDHGRSDQQDHATLHEGNRGTKKFGPVFESMAGLEAGADGVSFSVSRTFLDAIGYERSQWIGQPARCHKAVRQRVLAGETRTTELAFVADEVRNPTHRSPISTREISSLVSDTRARIEHLAASM